MSVKLQKEHFKLSEVVCSRYCQTTVENDIIVPDIKPDISKILQVSNTAVITKKNIQSDKVYIGGTIRLNILYVPEGETVANVKSIATTAEFSHMVDIKDATPEMEAWVEAECEPAEYTVVNSRKLNIRTKLGLGIRLSRCLETDIATDIDSGEPVQIKSTPLKIYNPCIDAERDLIIKERLEVPAGKPTMCEILKFCAKPLSTELRLLNDKAVLRGELKISTLYCGEGGNGTIEFMEHTVPFSEIAEIDGVRENMNGEIEYCIKDLYCEICQDADGDRRVLSCEFTLTAALRAFETLECNAIEDAYGLDSAVELETSSYSMEQLIDSTSAQVPVKEAVNIPDYLPTLRQLCDCSAVPTVESVSVESGSVTVNGYMNCSILYLSDDENTPLSGFNHILTFSHTFDIPGITPESFCDTKAETDTLKSVLLWQSA